MAGRWREEQEFAEELLQKSCEGYNRWIARCADISEYEEYGCTRLGKGADARVELREGGRTEDVTWLVDEMAHQLREVTVGVAKCWKNALEAFRIEHPWILDVFVNPSVPAGCFAPGTRVQVQWPTNSAANMTWLAASVVSVHKTGHHVVRYDIAGSWGDTERRVSRERLRSAPPSPGEG